MNMCGQMNPPDYTDVSG